MGKMKNIVIVSVILVVGIVWLFMAVYAGMSAYCLITGNVPLQDQGILTGYIEDGDVVMIEFDGEREYILDLVDGGKITYYGGGRKTVSSVFVGSYYYFYDWHKIPSNYGLSIEGLP